MKKKFVAALLCLVLVISLLPQQVFAVSIIDKVALTLEYPVAGKAPAGATCHGRGYSIYDIEWYDWHAGRYLEPGDKIQAGHQYAATIWVEADSGYEFKSANDNTPTVNATVNGTSAEVGKAYEYKAWAMITVTYAFESVPEKGWISSVDLTIPAPVTGAKPFYNKIETNSYHLANVYFSGNTDPKMKNGISWYNATNSQQLDPATGEVFAPETPYEFHCLIFPNEGYRITQEARVRVNGKSAEARLDYGTFLAVNYTFPATAPAETQPQHTHTPSGWRTTGAYHYKACTTCGDFLEQEDHYGGKATCLEKGKCTVCSYEYLETTEEHVPDASKWIARGSMYHFHACKLCGAHCDIEDHRWSPTYLYQDKTGHAWICADCKARSDIEPHNPGPAATETTPQTCKDCDYIIAPAKNHTHDLQKVPAVEATCTLPGNIEYYACTGCMNCFTDPQGKNQLPEDQSVELAPLGHKISDTWKNDGTYHWRVCSVCKEALEETKLLHDIEKGTCLTCGYGSTSSTNPQAPTTPQATLPAATDNGGSGNSWWILLLISLLAIGVGVGAGCAVLNRKKKE